MKLFPALRRKQEERAFSDWGSGSWFSPAGTGTNVTESSALRLSAVWACETLIADSIASMPADTYRKQGDIRTPTTAPVWVDAPNPRDSRIDFETQRVMSLIGWGNAYSMLIRQSNSSDPQAPVVERWPLNPDRVEWRTSSTQFGQFFYDGTPLPAGNLQHIPGYRLPGCVLGLSVIAYARQSLGLSLSAEQTGNALYENGIAPSGVLEVPDMPPETNGDVIERLREQFMERHAGTQNAGKPVVLVGGTKWNQTMINPSDAQFLETRMFQVEEICRWFRVPPHEIQHITNNASQGGGQGIEAQSLNLAKRTLTPWTVRLEQADTRLLPRGQFIRFNMNSFLRADIKTRYESYAIGRQNGWLSADEIRAWEDLQPIPGDEGGTYLQPLNMIDTAIANEVQMPDPLPVADPNAGDMTGE